MTNSLFPSDAKPIQLYGFEISGHSHRVQLILSLLDLPYELVPVHLTGDEYSIRHPFGSVPVMCDNGTQIWESNAILVYLAAKYDDSGKWLGRTPEEMANIQKWLSVAAGPLVQGSAPSYAAELFGLPVDPKKVENTTHTLLDIVEVELHKNQFLCADHATIADIALYTYISHAPQGGMDLAQYAYIVNWLGAVENLNGFVRMDKNAT